MAGRKRVSYHHSAGGIVYFRDQILLISTLQATRWQLPKGHVERGESPAQAAVREIREETGVYGLVVADLGPLEYRYRGRQGRKIHKRVDYFLCSYISGSTDDFDRHEVSGAQWMPWQQALELLTFDNERELVRRAHRIWRRHRAATAAPAGVTADDQQRDDCVEGVEGVDRVEGAAGASPAASRLRIPASGRERG